MIRFLNVCFEHAPGKGIRNINFAIRRGEFVLLVGPTGAGKTTILRSIYLELRPKSGQILIEDKFQRNDKLTDVAEMRQKIGIVFPEARLLKDRTIFENVALPLQIAGFKRREMHLQVNKALFQFGLQDRAQSYPAELSSGEQKKAAIARALVVRPFILLADEPLANVDFDASVEVLEHLQRINSEGMTILAATHVPNPYQGIAHRILYLKNGSLSEKP
ncbi:ATP-binding cassette domain-containing protein [bacterium]|nr:ATP-binding cassette domain-containing protein [bacterium]MBU1882423.1 ATP-binding cassette domain-containing protein [bacterium]